MTHTYKTSNHRNVIEGWLSSREDVNRIYNHSYLTLRDELEMMHYNTSMTTTQGIGAIEK